ncbi:MAG: energy-coupled thiamine transporter ThiT [Oscillospiraceae bacterium]|jgi:thiamine transporter|nr:energy-coupled thiamine transporter ThiT [Oscillospiraceae bacterium]
MNTSKQRTLTLAEGAICIALALILGSDFAEIRIGSQGGSLSFAMIPLLVFAVHSGGLGWGVGVGLLFGTLKFFIGGGVAVNWQSMLLDYSLAYGAVGLAGIFRGKFGVKGYLFGAIVGCAARFIIHYISGVTIYIDYAEATYLGVNTAAPWIYSVVYNGFYMLFNTVAAIILVPILGTAVSKIRGKS